ncbi:MAG: aldo/keto reductase, partial [bacterium]
FLQGLFFKKDIPENLKKFRPYQKEIIKICGDEDISIEELALRYVLGIDEIDSVIVGAETAAQVKENINISRKPKLPEGLLEKIGKLGSAPETVINPSLWSKNG